MPYGLQFSFGERFNKKTKVNLWVCYCASDNLVCKVFASSAEREIETLRLNSNCKVPVTVHLE